MNRTKCDQRVHEVGSKGILKKVYSDPERVAKPGKSRANSVLFPAIASTRPPVERRHKPSEFSVYPRHACEEIIAGQRSFFGPRRARRARRVGREAEEAGSDMREQISAPAITYFYHCVCGPQVLTPLKCPKFLIRRNQSTVWVTDGIRVLMERSLRSRRSGIITPTGEIIGGDMAAR